MIIAIVLCSSFRCTSVHYFDALIGYFRASGYFNLRPFLENVSEIRILVGINVDDLSAEAQRKGQLYLENTDKTKEEYLKFVADDIAKASYKKETEEGIIQFIEDIISKKVIIKAHGKRALHAKIYIFRPNPFNEHTNGSVITGSSNLTEAGLGTNTTSNYEFNVLLKDYEDVVFATNEFEELWSEATELQWDSILKYKPKYLIAVPSFLLKLIEYAEQKGIDYNASSVKGVICIGETLRNQDFSSSLLAEKVTNKWNINLHSTYASTEMSTAFTECEFFHGGHQHPELIITEILDDNDLPVIDGESGELTITTLGVEAMPLLRFKTGDIVKIHTETCSCGRNTPRVGPVLGRKQQMIKYKGTTLYPPVMHDLLASFDEIQQHVIEITTNSFGTDEIIIKVAITNTSKEFLDSIKDHFRAKLRVAPNVEVVSLDVINKIVFTPMSRKPIRFIDLRK